MKWFIAVLTEMSRGKWAQLMVGAATLCATLAAQAAALQIAGANSHGNSIYELTQSSSGLITGTSTLNTDAASHGSFKSLVWVPNAATGTLDLIAADTNNKQIVRYSGPNYTTGVALFTWHGLHQGPAEPEALAVDSAGDIFVVSSSCGSDVKASLWVLPVNKQGNYGAPVLIDDTFNNVTTSSLADTLVAGTTTKLWNAGDLLVLVADSFNPRVIVYSQNAIAGVIANPSKSLSGPTSTVVPLSKFASLSAVPVGMDLWPADATHGTSLLMTTTDGRILRFDTSSNLFDANFASGLGSGLENIKTGAAAGVEYAFVSQELSGYKGAILQFGAPPVNGTNTPLATVTKGASNPIGLAVTSSGSAPAQSCVSPDPACTYFGGALTLEISGPGSSNISGNILEQSCVVQSDPRVTVHGNAWSCNGQTLDVSTVCPGFPSTILPGSLCGHSGPTGSGFVVLKGTALGVDPVDNNTQIVAQSNINAILPGPLNQNCNPVSAYAWAPRPDLTANEGTIVEDALTPYFIDLTGFCDQPGVIQRGASMTSFGLALNAAASGLPNGLPGYVGGKYTNLLATVSAASVTSTVAANLDTYIDNSQTAFNSGVAGAPNGFSCAAYWADYADSYVRANLTAFSSNLTPAGGNPNPAFEISGRLANLFLTIETRVAGLPANTTWPPSSVPACVTLSASPASVPAGTATTLSWTALGVPTGSACTISGGTFTNQTEPASGSVSSGNLSVAGSPHTFDLVCPGTGTATSFDTAAVTVTAPTTAPVPSVITLTQAAATTAITSAGLKVGTVTHQTSTTVPAGNVISQTPAAGAPAPIGSSVNLIVSSGTKVPNVVGSTQTAATTTIDNAGLVVGTIAQQSSTTVAFGRVISESPLAGTLASAGSLVNIVVSSGITVPNVIGSTQATATAAITSAGLKLGTVAHQSSTTVPVGSVISQTPASGAAASAGSAVNLIVSSGTKVPNVVGFTQAAATTAINNAALMLGMVTQQSSTTIPIGKVISESPLAGTMLSTGSAVSIVVSSGGTAVPNVVGFTQSAATTAIDNAGLVVGTITQQSSTNSPIGNVISESPLAGTIVSPSSAVDIVISSGPPPAITSFGSSPTNYTTGSEALLNWTTTGEQSGDTCTLSATDGTYTTPTAVPVNGAVYTGAFTTAGTYTATLTCPNVATPATLNLTISVPMPLYSPNALAISPTNQNLYATNQAGDLSFDGPGGQVLVYTPSPFGMIQQPAQTIGPALNSTTNLQYPSALAFDAAGNLYVADGGSDQIFVLSLSPTGAATLLNTITVPPLTQGDESYNCEPVGLAVDGQGYLYVSCNGGYIGSAIYVYQNLNSSTPLVSWTGDTNDAFFSNMYGVALDGQSLLVGLSYDYETSQVVSYKLTDLQSVANNAAGGSSALPAGVTIQPPPNNDPNPSGSSPAQVNIAVDSSANIYIASTYVDYAQSGIPYYPYTVASYSPIVYDPTTGAPSGATQTNPTTPTASTYLQPVPTLQGAAAPSPLLTGPDGIALDVSGNLYVVDPVNSTIDVYAASSGNYEYDFLPLITLTTTPVGEEGQYTLTWTSIGIEPSNASCLLTTSDGQYNATPEPTQNTTGVTLGSNYVTATLSCPGAIAVAEEYLGE